MSDAVTTMRDVDVVATAVERLRTAMDHLAAPGDWTVADGGLDLRNGATRVVVSYDEPSHSIDVSVEGMSGERMACLRHILPTETQLEIAAREPRPAHMLALLAPMVRIASSAAYREPSSIPLDVDALSSMCSRFASACLAEGHVLEYVEVRPWIDGMTRISGHLPDGSTMEPTPSARAILTEGWRTAVEIDVHGYATTETRRAMMPPRGAPGIYLTICPQGGLMVEDVAADVVAAMRWAADPPVPSPMFTARAPDPSPMDGLWE